MCNHAATPRFIKARDACKRILSTGDFNSSVSVSMPFSFRMISLLASVVTSTDRKQSQPHYRPKRPRSQRIDTHGRNDRSSNVWDTVHTPNRQVAQRPCRLVLKLHVGRRGSRKNGTQSTTVANLRLVRVCGQNVTEHDSIQWRPVSPLPERRGGHTTTNRTSAHSSLFLVPLTARLASAAMASILTPTLPSPARRISSGMPPAAAIRALLSAGQHNNGDTQAKKQQQFITLGIGTDGHLQQQLQMNGRTVTPRAQTTASQCNVMSTDGALCVPSPTIETRRRRQVCTRDGHGNADTDPSWHPPFTPRLASALAAWRCVGSFVVPNSVISISRPP